MAKRLTFSAQFKAQVALEAPRDDKRHAVICREHNLAPGLVSRWREQLVDRAASLRRPSSRRCTRPRWRIEHLPNLTDPHRWGIMPKDPKERREELGSWLAHLVFHFQTGLLVRNGQKVSS